MSPFSERSASLGLPTQGGHLGRLHSNLLDLDERLREAVAQAIGQAAAGVVRQVVLSLLGEGDAGPAVLRFSPRQPGRSRPLWQALDDADERDRPPWLDDPEEDAFLRDRDADLDDRVIDPPRPSLGRRVLTAALPALGWWLSRPAGRRAVGAALGCGLACGLALYLRGRKAAGTGLALTLLTESVGAVADPGVRADA
jgi:hypothetical protein